MSAIYSCFSYSTLERLASQNNTNAMVELGFRHANLVATGHNPENVEGKAAVSYFQRAADAGDVNGQYALANCYENGIGIKQDKVKAKELLNTLGTKDKATTAATAPTFPIAPAKRLEAAVPAA